MNNSELKTSIAMNITIMVFAAILIVCIAAIPSMKNALNCVLAGGMLGISILIITWIQKGKDIPDQYSVVAGDVDLTQCPDYYTQDIREEDGIYCKNQFNTADMHYSYIFAPSKPELNEILIMPFGGKPSSKSPAFTNSTYKNVCDNNIKKDNNIYNEIPWTNLKAQCSI